MNRFTSKYIIYFCFFSSLLLVSSAIRADLSDIFEEIAKEALEGEIDKNVEIQDVRVVERYGNKIVVEIPYKNIFRPNDVTMEIYFIDSKGQALSGLTGTKGFIEGKKGTVKFNVVYAEADSGVVQKSNKINITLKRNGTKIKNRLVDFLKEWTALTEVDLGTGSDDEIELADDSTITEVGEEQETPTEEETPAEETPVVGAKTYTYTARTKMNVRRTGIIKLGSVSWNCRANSNICSARGPWPNPSYRACNALAKKVGQITYYGHPRKRLTTLELKKCNPTPRSTSVNYTYTARTKAKVRRSGIIKLGSVSWNCRANSNICSARGPWPNPSYRACNALAKKVGQITYYGHPRKRLTTLELKKCNPTPRSTSVNYTYTARTKAKVRRSGIIKLGPVSWNCRANSNICTARGPWPNPSYRACNALAKKVGQITYYGHPRKRLTTLELKKCNPTPRSTSVNYTYTARTKAKVRRSGIIKLGPVSWNCRANSNICSARGPWPNPSYRACNALAKKVGQITYYGHPRKRLTTLKLKKCNTTSIKQLFK